MSLEAIRQQIRVIASGVPGVGRIHDYERFSAEYSKFLELFKVDGRINGFMFFRIQRIERFLWLQENRRSPMCSVFAACADLEDAEATGIAFDDHVEDLCSALQSARRSQRKLRHDQPGLGDRCKVCGVRRSRRSTFANSGPSFAILPEGRLCAVETLDIEEERSDIGAEWGEFAWGSIPWGCVA